MATANALVIFDCDGVLVDSEPISIAVLTEVIRDAGIEIPQDQAYQRFLGRSMGAIVADLEAEDGLAMTRVHLAEIRERLYARFRRELRPIAGVRAMLAGIDRAFCVASSSQPERLRLSLEVTGLLETFEPHIYSSSEVRAGKPAPDLFLHAARSMEVAPKACVVVEDSPAGIIAAKSAGMRVLAFTGGSHVEPSGLRDVIEGLKPDAMFDDMRRLPELLGQLDGRETAP